MSKGMSPALEEAAQEPEILSRMLVTIYAPDDVTFRFVANDNADLTLPGGETYISAEIKIGDMDTSTDGDKEAISLELSNKWREWAAYMANNGQKLKNCLCVIEEVFLDELDEGTIEHFRGKLDKLSMTISKFTCSVIRDTVDYDIEAPAVDYGPTCQWTFGDNRCKYSGSGGPCDQTLNSCDALGNVLNYQGHPSIPREMVIRS